MQFSSIQEFPLHFVAGFQPDRLKREFLGRPMRAKGFKHREVALAWGVLTHNLWVLARMRDVKPEAKKQRAPRARAA